MGMCPVTDAGSTVMVKTRLKLPMPIWKTLTVTATV